MLLAAESQSAAKTKELAECKRLAEEAIEGKQREEERAPAPKAKLDEEIRRTAQAESELRMARNESGDAKRILDETQIAFGRHRGEAEERAASDARVLASLQEDLTRERQHAAVLAAEAAALLKSTSWRLSGPWRAYIRMVSRIRRLMRGKWLNPLFDHEWYLQQYPDVKESEIDSYDHYLRHGAAEGRDPNPLFDTDWYLQQNPDVRQSGENPLTHFYSVGAKEGRDPIPLFDVKWYLEQNADVRSAGTNPLRHFIYYGSREGRNPNPFFDTSWYLAQNPDVARLNLNPLVHYRTIGAARGSNPSPRFDVKWYLDQYVDVARSGREPLDHFLQYGRSEGRAPSRNCGPRPGAELAGVAKSPISAFQEDTDPHIRDEESCDSPGGQFPAIRRNFPAMRLREITGFNDEFDVFLAEEITNLIRMAESEPSNQSIISRLEYKSVHRLRYSLTMRELNDYIDTSHDVLETGGYSNISYFLSNNGISVSETKTDLRYSVQDIGDQSRDVVFSFEVIEHIKDQDGSGGLDIEHDTDARRYWEAIFNSSGVSVYISEMFRVLRSGGIVVVTTPNACATNLLGNIIAMQAAFMFRPHVREYAPAELRYLFERQGFITKVLKTIDAYPAHPDRPTYDNFLAGVGADMSLRGDTILAIFQRP